MIEFEYEAGGKFYEYAWTSSGWQMFTLICTGTYEDVMWKCGPSQTCWKFQYEKDLENDIIHRYANQLPAPTPGKAYLKAIDGLFHERSSWFADQERYKNFYTTIRTAADDFVKYFNKEGETDGDIRKV